MRYLKAIIILLTGCLLTFHFIIIALYHLPDNPIKHKYKYFVLGYINPIFSQEWKLFAPNPVSSNMSISYQYSFIKNGKNIATSPILDVNAPVVIRRKNNFFSTDLRLLKYFSACCVNIIETRQEINTDFLPSKPTKDDTVRLEKVSNMAVEECFGNKSIKEYSKFVFNKYYSTHKVDYDSVKVQYQINNAIFPRFSKRYLDYNNPKNYTYSRFYSKTYLLKSL